MYNSPLEDSSTIDLVVSTSSMGKVPDSTKVAFASSHTTDNGCLC